MNQQKIWKHTVNVVDIRDEMEVLWPAGAVAVSAALQYSGQISIWYRCRPSAPLTKRTILFRGTDHSLPAEANFIATIPLQGGVMILHILEVLEP